MPPKQGAGDEPAVGEVRDRGGAPRLERERRLTGPAVRGARHGDDGAGPALPLSPGRPGRGAGPFAGALFGGSGWTAQAGAAGVGDPVALKTAVRPVGDGPLDEPGFEERIEVHTLSHEQTRILLCRRIPCRRR